jgi:hypothetical protein
MLIMAKMISMGIFIKNINFLMVITASFILEDLNSTTLRRI